MKEKKRAELLAPAGSFASLKAAVAAGADAVYMGGARFGARAYAQNADQDEMIAAIEYAHLHGCRLYMTVNTLFKDNELGELYEYLLPYYKAGLDGVIVQDLGALSFIREHFPGIELHASTQMTITSVYGAKELKRLGCCRVVPAREVSLEEIRRIYDETGMDIETFVHGALCYCYSGQCLMSSLIGGRSGNRGRCAQPCRLPYRVYGQENGTAVNKEDQKCVLSMKDLCTLDILPQILEAGVFSLKIEGRMKSPRYTAGVVRIYRKYLDRYLEYGSEGYYVEPEDKKELLDLFDRGGFTSGYYTRHNGRDMIALKEKPEFRETNKELFDFLDREYVETEKKEPVEGYAYLAEGLPSVLTLTCGDISVTVSGQEPQAAKNQPMTREKVIRQLGKTGATAFEFTELEAEVCGALFLPVQALNELRREGFEALTEAIQNQWRRKAPEAGEVQNGADSGEKSSRAAGCAGPVPDESAGKRPMYLTVSAETGDQLSAALAVPEVRRICLDASSFQPERWAEFVQLIHQAGKECYLTLPHIFRTHAIGFFRTYRSCLEQAGFDGLLIRAFEEIQWMREEQISFSASFDASVYAWNHGAVHTLKEEQAAFITAPWELNSRELEPVFEACRREGLPAELIVYGRAPMMVSAQCITKTVKGCSKCPSLLWMKDRTGARLPVQNHCAFCYNTILNPLPVSLHGCADSVKRLAPEGLRLCFTIETGEETKAVLNAFAAEFIRGENAEPPFTEFTRGHFRRGVE
ncbi:MAG: U32 family peptidase [Clostridium sp.]|nr:U32 family peptidase [Clostridium sp.]